MWKQAWKIKVDKYYIALFAGNINEKGKKIVKYPK